MTTVDDISRLSVDSGDLESDSRILYELLSTDLTELRAFPGKLRESLYLRELAPLLIEKLVYGIVYRVSDQAAIVSVLRVLPQCCRPGEVHSFSLDVWIKLWTEHHSADVSFARSVVAFMVVDVIVRAEKGSFFRNREDYLLSFAGQVLTKYWLHSNDGVCEWGEIGAMIVKAFASWNSSDESDHLNLARSEICVRIVAAQVRFGHDFTPSLRAFKSEAVLMNFFTTRLQTVSTKLSAARAGDFEIIDADLALLLAAESLNDFSDTFLVPLIWTKKKRDEIYAKCLQILLRENCFLGAKMFLAVKDVLLVPQIFQLVVETATSLGSETDLTLPDRRAVYDRVYALLTNTRSVDESLSVCEYAVRHSRADSCVGIFIKIAKDVAPNECVKFAKLVGTDFDIVDSVDSLKSVLNWLRIAIIPAEEKAVLKNLVSIWGEKIDRELPQIENLAHTRVMLIAHLLSIVKSRL